MVIIHVKDFGDINITLDRANAPETCANFVELAKKGFYDGLTFMRVIKGFMIQGGDPKNDCTGGPGYSIKGEFRINGVDNKLSHKPGVISMARSAHPDSAGSQFFICDGDCSFLDGQYAAFGQTDEAGYAVVRKIAKVRTNKSVHDKPYDNVVIEKVTVVDEEDAPFKKLFERE